MGYFSLLVGYLLCWECDWLAWVAETLGVRFLRFGRNDGERMLEITGRDGQDDGDGRTVVRELECF